MTDVTEQSLWDDLKSAIRDAFTVWGEPQQLAADHAFRRLDARLLREWLGPLETIARALVTAMAMRLVAALPKPALSSRAKRGTSGRAEARPAEAPAAAEAARSTPEDGQEGSAPPPDGAAPSGPPSSETWTGVRFNLARRPGTKKAAKRRRRRAARGGPRDIVPPPLALARRFEALIRVVQKPEPYARRLARILATDRYAAARVLARPKPVRCPDTGFDRPILYGDIMEDALALAWAAMTAPRAPDVPAADSG